jgi:hypothetical protein
MKRIFVIAICFTLSGCGSFAAHIRNGLNHEALQSDIGKPYSRVVYDHPAYGPLVGRAKLANGDIIYKHVGRFGNESSGYLGIYVKDKHIDRAIYFEVAPDGRIVDYATGFFHAGSTSCMLIFCGGKSGTPAHTPTSALDAVVKTSTGQPISSWGPVSE